jgi:peptidoglycan/LPS O-acetylase OafA/YrhL
MRNTNLDALRGVAILMVLGRHLNFVSLWTRMGWAGVDLFFVLSGYLISGLLFAEWQRSGSIDFRRFFIRRGFKIYPAFYFLLITTALVNLLRPGIPSNPVTWRSMLAEATFTQNYFPGIWGQTWSLGVEEHFYILLPIALWLMYRAQRNTPDPFRWLPALFMIVATVEILLRIAVARTLTSNAQEATYLCPTHLRIDALLFGVVIRYYREFQPAKFTELSQGKTGWVIVSLATLLLAILPSANAAMHTIGFSLVYFGCGFLLARCIDFRPHRYVAIVIVRPLAAIGYYSYSIYLWHGWIARLLLRHTALEFAGCLVASIALGVAMARLVEYPMLALRDRLMPPRNSLASEPAEMAIAGY